MIQASNNGSEVSRSLIDFYFLSLQVGGWPELLAQVDHITHDITDSVERTAEAALLWERLDNDRNTLDRLREGIMDESRRAGQMADRPDPGCPTGFELAFTDYEPMQRLLMYTAVSMTLNRLMLRVSEELYESLSPEINAEHRRLGELVWRCLPQMRRLGPVSSLLFLTPVSMSLEAAHGDEVRGREVVETMMRLGAAAGKLPQEVGALEKMMLDNVRRWTGRSVPPQLSHIEDMS